MYYTSVFLPEVFFPDFLPWRTPRAQLSTITSGKPSSEPLPWAPVPVLKFIYT